MVWKHQVKVKIMGISGLPMILGVGKERQGLFMDVAGCGGGGVVHVGIGFREDRVGQQPLWGRYYPC
jgi:hypothetical protein